MALTERLLAARFNRPGFEVVDHFTYCIAGDGDLQEGIVHEAASLAGHLGLGKLICLFDDNRVQIDGPTSAALSENTLARFELRLGGCGAGGWPRHGRDRGRDPASSGVSDRPSIVACRTTMGSAAQSSPAATAHYTRSEPTSWRGRRRRSACREITRSGSRTRSPPTGGAPSRQVARTRPIGKTCSLATRRRTLTSRKASGAPSRASCRTVGTAICPLGRRPERRTTGRLEEPARCRRAACANLIGGSADLSQSTGAQASSAVAVRADDFTGSFIRYGIREHAMAGVMNGMALHGGVVPYGTTYLVFTDYLRASLRLSALMGIGVIHVWTHDSVYAAGVGPTHQAIEQLASLRAIPNLLTIRPADANETVAAWRYALSHRDRPVALVLAAHALPVLDEAEGTAGSIDRGAYVLADDPEPQVILLATGSEVSVAMAARDSLAGVGVRARVVNMPCWRLFGNSPRTTASPSYRRPWPRACRSRRHRPSDGTATSDRTAGWSASIASASAPRQATRSWPTSASPRSTSTQRPLLSLACRRVRPGLTVGLRRSRQVPTLRTSATPATTASSARARFRIG